jgi:hypothetical protein
MTHEPNRAERQSSPLDVGVFVAAVLLGLAVYFLLRALLHERAQIPITATLIAVMLCYSVAVARISRVGLRLDQAGDNAYYLGLLFTLTSMAFALWDFRLATQSTGAASGVQQIISNFGIALGTTICGILLRVALHQMRVDPADLEAMTRVELTEAAERLRGILDTTTSDLARFHLEVQQRQTDVLQEMVVRFGEAATQVQKSLAESSAKMVKHTEDSYKTMLEGTNQLMLSLKSLATEATGAIERLMSVQAPLALSRRLEKFGDVLQRVANESERTTTGFQTVVAETAKAVAAVKDTAELLKSLTADIRAEQASIATDVSKAAQSLTLGLEGFNSRLRDVLADVTQLQERLKETSTGSVRAQEAATDVITALTSIVREMTTVLKASGPHALA